MKSWLAPVNLFPALFRLNLRKVHRLTLRSYPSQLQLLILRQGLPCRCRPPPCPPALPVQKCRDRDQSVRILHRRLYVPTCTLSSAVAKRVDSTRWGVTCTNHPHHYFCRRIHHPRRRPGRLLRRQGSRCTGGKAGAEVEDRLHEIDTILSQDDGASASH